MKSFAGNAAAVRAELDRVLGSPAFSASQRSREFLRFVVEETLAGRADQLKERSIAMAVFARGESYDPGGDSIVRVKAVEVRKRLAQHYAGGTGSSIRIEIPQGGYVPRFDEKRSSGGLRVGRGVVLSLLLGAVGLGTVVWMVAARSAASNLDRVWAPILAAPSPVVIGLPSPLIYSLESKPSQPVRPEEVLIAENYYVGTGAAYGAAQVAAMIAARGGRFVVKIGPDVSYEDLKNQSAVFLGAHSSAWTMKFTKKLRYQFAIEGDLTGVVDVRPDGAKWMKQRRRLDIGSSEDYSIVARIHDESTGHPILLIAGCGPRGTHAAAEFVSSESAFRQFAKAAPPDWPRKNFEVVLRAEIHGSVPGKPRLLAWHVW